LNFRSYSSISPLTSELGETFSTPEAVLVRSGEGLGGMSRTIHRLFLDRLLPRNWSDDNPPILLNSWEAKYFHVNHSNIVEMTRQVSKLAILNVDLWSSLLVRLLKWV
jgi:alpha-galactosidase